MPEPEPDFDQLRAHDFRQFLKETPEKHMLVPFGFYCTKCLLRVDQRGIAFPDEHNTMLPLCGQVIR